MTKAERFILFIDESGKSKLSDEGDNILLCGLIINKDLHSAVSSYMISLKGNSGILPDQNIHAFDLFEDEFRLLKKKRRDRTGYRVTHAQISVLFERMCHLIQGTEMKHLIVRLDKRTYQKRIEKAAKKNKIVPKLIVERIKKAGLNDFLYEGLTRKLILEFAHFLEENDAYGEVVAESRRNGDSEVLNAFLAATQSSNYEMGTVYQKWSGYAHARISSLTFQNKKGLSFGLEVADLFAWAHYNSQYGIKPNSEYSAAKKRRITDRIDSVAKMMKDKNCILKGGIEQMSENKFASVAPLKVSEFTKIL